MRRWGEAGNLLHVTSRKHVQVWTDGSCETQTGDGGWAYLLRHNSHELAEAGHETATTNNRMELTAAVKALASLTEACDVTLTTDSQYLKKAFTEGWLTRWLRNGWRTASREPVKNQDLWQELLVLTERHQVKWSWTRGHSGHLENETVDKLALNARKEQRPFKSRSSN